jgi:PAB1-binding protein PBP1
VRVHTEQRVYEGIFHGADPAQTDGLAISLRMAHVVSEKGKRYSSIQKSTLVEHLQIPARDLVQLNAVSVDVDFMQQRTAHADRKGREFQTDTNISGHGGEIIERQLERWDGGEGDGEVGSLDDEVYRGWDQFAVNEKLFGVSTDFREDLYTTRLDKSSEEYRRREKEADRLAREIEGVRSLIM